LIVVICLIAVAVLSMAGIVYTKNPAVKKGCLAVFILSAIGFIISQYLLTGRHFLVELMTFIHAFNFLITINYAFECIDKKQEEKENQKH
jgi:hypothetical protein